MSENEKYYVCSEMKILVTSFLFPTTSCIPVLLLNTPHARWRGMWPGYLLSTVSPSLAFCSSKKRYFLRPSQNRTEKKDTRGKILSVIYYADTAFVLLRKLK